MGTGLGSVLPEAGWPHFWFWLVALYGPPRCSLFRTVVSGQWKSVKTKKSIGISYGFALVPSLWAITVLAVYRPSVRPVAFMRTEYWMSAPPARAVKLPVLMVSHEPVGGLMCCSLTVPDSVQLPRFLMSKLPRCRYSVTRYASAPGRGHHECTPTGVRGKDSELSELL